MKGWAAAVLASPAVCAACPACAARGVGAPGLNWLMVGIVLAPIGIALAAMQVIRRLEKRR